MGAKTADIILGLLKKDFIRLGIEKKNALGFRDSLIGFIKAVYYYHFSLLILIKLDLLNSQKRKILKISK